MTLNSTLNSRQLELASSITQGLKLTQNPSRERPGRKYTECIYCGHETRPPSWSEKYQKFCHHKTCHTCQYMWDNHKFRLTPEDRVLLDSAPWCQICGTQDNLHIDHCHETNTIRGYLCSNHNTAIGLLGENINLFHLAIDYLTPTYENTL